ncbi:MAG: HAD-IA family hydrolase [Pseudomonas lundensis]|uniref:HAD-IA family hydrolase n=1 Tax=Pseudomonas lundensis TaxID=86185 RepID=UPI000641A6D6|nr:HAD-IA family hydrolase [Pseudomonas lundensis]NLT99931.1 HAD-IA family hydrolase [Pseudomonas lundensis]NNA31908.1 HAD-IA family hydrolase [Pseudomonas lundensis]NNA41458.1 HAD-IA family hydrolase [Pseudomonas lundensis]
MSSEYKLLIFDWDGTLADSIGRIVTSMQEAAQRAGRAERDDEAIKGIIGLGLPEAILTLYPDMAAEQVIAFRQHYANTYIALDAEPSPLFVGVVESLEAFRAQGYRLAVATGKARRGLDRVLKAHGWERFFDVTRAADETASKPDPLMLNQILAHCDMRPEQALMVGDASFDLLMARNAGIDSVAVSYGAQSIERLRGFDPVLEVDHFPELRGWLEARAHSRLC